ncbi:MAG: hypothetical protein B0W54_00915 [Cellvibrio sp. 79]|nr:MAG: hypothetical protein B0W54_00915 [Cellvibrio sp. 79]
MMKRSKKAALVLMVPATTLLLASCGEERETALVYESPEECSAATFNTPEQCKADYDEAKALHPLTAPKFESQADCETEFGAGKCEQAPTASSGGSGFFMPMMMGYMMGQMMNRNSAAAAQNFQQNSNPSAAGANGRNIRTQPLYKGRDDYNNFRTSNNVKLDKGIGPIQLKPSQVQPQFGQVAKRSGFGSQGAARSGGSTFGG